MKKKESISYKLYGKKTIKKMQEKIDLLGYNTKYDAISFLNLRYFSSVIVFFVILYISSMGYLYAPLITMIYFILLPKVMIDSKINKRRDELNNDALYFFEVLTLSLESGRSLKNALEVTANNIDSSLAKEFRYALEEMKYGKSLNEVLAELKKHIPSDTINNIILSAEQSNIFGSSIIDTMYNQLDYIRDKQIMETKAKINKIPMKISVVSVIFIIPLILLIVLSPIILNLIGG